VLEIHLHGVGADGRGRRDAGDEFLHDLLELRLVLAFEQAAGDAQRHGQQWDDGQQRGIGQCRRAHQTAMADETGG